MFMFHLYVNQPTFSSRWCCIRSDSGPKSIFHLALVFFFLQTLRLAQPHLEDLYKTEKCQQSSILKPKLDARLCEFTGLIKSVWLTELRGEAVLPPLKPQSKCIFILISILTQFKISLLSPDICNMWHFCTKGIVYCSKRAAAEQQFQVDGLPYQFWRG